MALSGSTLGNNIKAALKPEIKTKLEALFPMGNDAFAQEQLNDFCEALADAIGKIVGEQVVTHITSSAIVTATGADPQGGTQTVTGTVS